MKIHFFNFENDKVKSNPFHNPTQSNSIHFTIQPISQPNPNQPAKPFTSSMKLTARNNRTIYNEGSAIHSSTLFSSEKNKNGDGDDDDDGDDEYHDSTNKRQRNRNRNGNKRRHNTFGSTYLRRLTIRWSLARFSSKVAFVVASLLIVLVGFIRLWDHQFSYQIGGFGESNNNSNNNPSSVSSSSSSSSPSSFAIVINTFRRPERLQQTVRHYADTCGRQYNIGQIFVVWADPNTDPPSLGELFLDDSSDSSLSSSSLPSFVSLRGGNTNNGTIVSGSNGNSNRARVEILVKPKDSLNARFEPIPHLRTTSVFMVDDDIRVACSSLQMAFRAWKKHPDSMVGYYPRLAAASATATSGATSSGTPTQLQLQQQQHLQHQHQHQFVYHAWPMVYWRQKFNIVLTKASFLHSKYLELYTNDDSFPKEIKDHVDRHRNCEDIAMSMLVANYTKHNNNNDPTTGSTERTTTAMRTRTSARPYYVEGTVSDVGLFGGISSGTGHFATRSDCLTQLTDILRSKGWGSPLEDEFDLVASSWVQHSPGFWWQSGPSNVFEWFGLANIFS